MLDKIIGIRCSISILAIYNLIASGKVEPSQRGVEHSWSARATYLGNASITGTSDGMSSADATDPNVPA
jgi:hypothetical protein